MNPEVWHVQVAIGVAQRNDRDRKRAAQVARSRASQPRRRDNLKGRRP